MIIPIGVMNQGVTIPPSENIYLTGFGTPAVNRSYALSEIVLGRPIYVGDTGDRIAWDGISKWGIFVDEVLMYESTDNVPNPTLVTTWTPVAGSLPVGVASATGPEWIYEELAATQNIANGAEESFWATDVKTTGAAGDAGLVVKTGIWYYFDQVAGNGWHMFNGAGWKISGWDIDFDSGQVPGGLKIYSSSDASKMFVDKNYDANWTLRVDIPAGSIADPIITTFDETDDVVWAFISGGNSLSSHMYINLCRPIARRPDWTALGHSWLPLNTAATIVTSAAAHSATSLLVDGLNNQWWYTTNPTTVANGWLIFDFNATYEIGEVIVAHDTGNGAPNAMRLLVTNDDLDSESGTFASWTEVPLRNEGYAAFKSVLGVWPNQGGTFPYRFSSMFPIMPTRGRKFAIQIEANVPDWLELREVKMRGKAL